MFFCECGTGSFKHVVDEDQEDLGCTGASPKGRRKHGGKANPYAELGLDRFSVVLSELQTRRAKILRRVRSDDTGLVFVRFVQSNGDWTPIVVKLPEVVPSKGVGPKKPRAAASSTAGAAPPLRPAAHASSGSPPGPASPREREGIKKAAAATASAKVKVPARRASFSWRRTMRRPSCYWPSVIVLTLVSLAVFGRVFAICLTSIWWYVLPTLGSGCSDHGAGDRGGLRMSMEKKKLVWPAPHAKKGSVVVPGVHEAVSSPTGHAKGKRG